MTDTPRTEADLLALVYPESSFGPESDSAGSVPIVTPQTIRDLIVSVYDSIATAQATAEPSYGAYYFSSAAATAVAAQGTDLKAAGTTAAIGTPSADLTVAVTNRITNAGTTRVFLVTASLDLTVAADAKSITVSLYKTGAAITGAFRTYTHATGATRVQTVIQALVSLAATDYVEVWVANETDAEDITVQAGQVSVLGLS
jgi:hypothetical protein